MLTGGRAPASVAWQKDLAIAVDEMLATCSRLSRHTSNIIVLLLARAPNANVQLQGIQ
jgi:hypothetical protein